MEVTVSRKQGKTKVNLRTSKFPYKIINKIKRTIKDTTGCGNILGSTTEREMILAFRAFVSRVVVAQLAQLLLVWSTHFLFILKAALTHMREQH